MQNAKRAATESIPAEEAAPILGEDEAAAWHRKEFASRSAGLAFTLYASLEKEMKGGSVGAMKLAASMLRLVPTAAAVTINNQLLNQVDQRQAAAVPVVGALSFEKIARMIEVGRAAEPTKLLPPAQSGLQIIDAVVEEADFELFPDEVAR